MIFGSDFLSCEFNHSIFLGLFINYLINYFPIPLIELSMKFTATENWNHLPKALNRPISQHRQLQCEIVNVHASERNGSSVTYSQAVKSITIVAEVWKPQPNNKTHGNTISTEKFKKYIIDIQLFPPIPNGSTKAILFPCGRRPLFRGLAFHVVNKFSFGSPITKKVTLIWWNCFMGQLMFFPKMYLTYRDKIGFQ